MKLFIFFVSIVLGCLSVQGEYMLQKGTVAPEFTLKSQDGATVTLSSFKDKNYVVLIFYPGDQTPVCTQQLCEIRDDYSQFEQRGAVVFGVNPGSEKSHQAFVGKHSFQFKLLIDTKSEVAKKYMSKGAMMNQRTVYVINKEGIVVFAERGKPPVAKILESIPVSQ